MPQFGWTRPTALSAALLLADCLLLIRGWDYLIILITHKFTPPFGERFLEVIGRERRALSESQEKILNQEQQSCVFIKMLPRF